MKTVSVATNVAVDLQDLDCTLCAEPLRPPVFQCAAGHVVCSTCYELLEKDKCQGCSITTSYSRCFAIERILQSVQIPCSNAGYGCVAKKAYHEMEEHEKNCVHARSSNTMQPTFPHHGLPMDYCTLVIPKVSPSTSISISFNKCEKKKKAQDDKSSIPDNKISKMQRLVVKMGPCGGGGGDARKMDMRGVNRIVKVVVRHGSVIDAISVFYEREGREDKTKRWGGPGGKRSEICLHKDEFLTSVKGCYGHFDGWFVIRSLTFISNRRTFGPYGKGEGTAFELPAAGGKIIGFHGRSGSLLDALGTYVKMG